MKLRILISILLWSILANISVRASDTLMVKVIMIERSIMENESVPAIRDSLLLEKALLYKALGQYEAAVSTLERLDSSANRQLMCRVYYERTLNLFLSRSYSSALYEAWNMEKCGLDTNEKRLLYLMVLIENENWAQFTIEFLNQAALAHYGDTLNIKNQFMPVLLDPDYYYRKSWIPGRGLLMAGFGSEGVTNISLQLIFAGFTAYNIYTGFYLTSFFSGFQPMRRFYHGGRTLTSALVYRRNANKISQLKQKGYCYINLLYPS